MTETVGGRLVKREDVGERRVPEPVVLQQNGLHRPREIPTLIGGLVHTLRSNLNRGEERVRIFEIGRCFEGEKADLAVQPERIRYAWRLPAGREKGVGSGE